jgi:hypothetical protein
MFNFSPKTNFGLAINILSSRVMVLPQMVGTRRHDSRTFPESTAVVTQCPAELLHLARGMGLGLTRLASLQVGGAHFGIAMVLGNGHFAASLFDLGEEKCQAMAKQALKDGEIHLLLNHADDFLLVVPKLTSGCRNAFSMARNARPASVEEFAKGVQSIEGALRKEAAWEQMGIDARSLTSITLSVCVPGLDVVPELEIRHASDVERTMH